MGFRKFRGSQLFTGTGFAPDDSVLVTDEGGKVEGIVPEADAGSDIQFVEGIISPGFVNCHCHLELSHLKAVIPEGTGMVPFLMDVMQRRGEGAERIQDAITHAEHQMWATGIVAVGDICNTTDTLTKKRKPLLFYHNFVEVSGFVEAGAAGRFSIAESVARQMADTGPTTIVPHAPYSVSPALFNYISASTPELPITMHNQESKDENDFFLTGDSGFRKLFESLGVNLDFFIPPGVSSIRAVLPHLRTNGILILVHNVVTSAEDIAQIKQHNSDTYFCLCPNANRHINDSMPPVDLLINNGCKIVLGTDSLASNSQLSILEEIKTLQSAYPSLPIEQLLTWATSEGANALGISDRFGSFAPGKTPGIIQINNGQSIRRL
ncbi:amidohydrolase family protein [Flavihumibacter solisilvae]|uniref:amidohydrolase family protein n=1 Tax=Flavihumibacter solisilvae TaxID=1349421 RepID=UPI0006911D5F|nr:amidohydrolase family protein [Flavihumibacter solisilvae]